MVAIKTGRSEASRRIVMSHTASLAGADALIDDLFERAGVARVESLEELVEALKVLHVLGPLPGGRIGAMSTSGGDLTLLGDAMIGTDLSLPPLSEAGAERVRATVHERIAVANPLDYQMFDWNDAERLSATFGALIAEGFDVNLCLLDYPRADRCDPSTWAGAEQGFVEAAGRTGAASGVLSTFTDTLPESVAERLLEKGIVPLAGIRTGLAGIQAAVDVGRGWRAEACAPLLEADGTAGPEQATLLDEAEAKALLRAQGIPVPAGRVVTDLDSAVEAADAIGYPVAVKVLGLAHKSERGAVALDLRDSQAVAAAFTSMADLGERFLVEAMVQGAVAELIVGVARDAQFGPHLIVGAGGVLVELIRDSRVLLLPTTAERVGAVLSGLRCAPLLNGFRGRPRADVAAAARPLLSIADLVERDPSAIIELDVNPLLLLEEGRGGVAADTLLRLRADAAAGGNDPVSRGAGSPGVSDE
ncbi:MAG: acetate--CoA ligase family protein [Thermoanaerobaculia bacterium]|nr:acetate--CoA ligase family protein [Thermoanaerobaculia bacterium]